MKKTTLGTIIGVSAITGGIILGGKVIAPVLANTAVSYSAPIANIAKKFNLDPAKVQEAFDEGRTQERQDRLTQLVKDGKLTDAQKAKILEYEQKIVAKREELIKQGATPEEMRKQMDTLHTEFRNYLESEKLTDIIPDRGRGRMGDRDGMRK